MNNSEIVNTTINLSNRDTSLVKPDKPRCKISAIKF